MLHFDFRVLYARADDYGMARRAIITYSKQPFSFDRQKGIVYKNGLWIELGICTVRVEWKTYAKKGS